MEVLLIVRKKFICKQISISEILELAFIKIQTYKHALIVTACYLPPIYSKEQSKTLFEEISGFINKSKKYPVWIGGNFKLADMDWETRSVTSHQYSKDINGKNLLKSLMTVIFNSY